MSPEPRRTKCEADRVTIDRVPVIAPPWYANAAEVERLSDGFDALRQAGDALADAVSDLMADDPESALHTWAHRWRRAVSDV